MGNENTPKLNIKAFTFGGYAVNTYVVGDEQYAMIIDMPASTNEDFSLLDCAIGDRELSRIVYTHGHFDHIHGADLAREHYKGISQYIHEKDNIMFTDANENLTGLFGNPLTYHGADFLFQGDDIFNIGSIQFSVIHTPGHTGGCVCYYSDGYLFTGDTIFYMGVGRTDLPHSDYNLLKTSIEKIFTLPDDTFFFPGHDRYSVKLGGRKSSFI